MKMVELFGTSAVDSPRLTGTEEGGKYRCMVDHQPGGKAQFSLSHPSRALLFAMTSPVRSTMLSWELLLCLLEQGGFFDQIS